MAYHNINNLPSPRVYTDTSQPLMGLGDDTGINSWLFMANFAGVMLLSILVPVAVIAGVTYVVTKE